MAIIKISPLAPMTVGGYRQAALRHLHTCEALWNYLNTPALPGEIKSPDEHILENIFYLTGYVVECAIKYRYLTDCHSLNDTDDEACWSAKSIKIKFHFSFSSNNGDKTNSEKVISDLCVSSSGRPIPNYLKILGNVSLLTGMSTVEQDMQESWNPQIRYYYAINGLPSPPNQTDIETFYNATCMLMHNLAIL